MKTIDINCDLGEGIGNDELIMPYISSANVACGYHAGDEKTMKQTVELCKKYSVAVVHILLILIKKILAELICCFIPGKFMR